MDRFQPIKLLQFIFNHKSPPADLPVFQDLLILYDLADDSEK